MTDQTDLAARANARIRALEDKIASIDYFVRNLLWDAHPECCGQPSIGATYMGQNEEVCCGCPEYDTLNDAQIVMSLRAKFPENISAEPA